MMRTSILIISVMVVPWTIWPFHPAIIVISIPAILIIIWGAKKSNAPLENTPTDNHYLFPVPCEIAKCGMGERLSINKISVETIFYSAFVLSLLVMMLWFHVIRLPSDYEIESIIMNSIDKRGKIYLNDLVKNGNTACFMQFYADADGLKEYIENDDFIYLKRRIATFIGIGDHVWWIVVLNRRKIISLYRMSGRIKLNRSIQGSQCFLSKDYFIDEAERYGSIIEIKINKQKENE